MKTLEEVIENFDKYDNTLDGRFGVRLCKFLTLEQIDKIGYELTDELKGKHQPLEWTKQNILTQLKEDVDFGFEKALNRRGISSSLMFNVVLSWNRILEDGLEEYNEKDYAMYGLPLFKETAVKYGWDNPIGEDSGTEEYYNE